VNVLLLRGGVTKQSLFLVEKWTPSVTHAMTISIQTQYTSSQFGLKAQQCICIHIKRERRPI